jgi:MFS family permease
MGGMALASFTQIFGPLSAAPQVPYYMAEFDASLPQVIQFIGVAILVLGFSNLIWVPFARAFGRRPMLLLTNLITIASSIWRAEAKSYNSFLGACILSGIGTGPSETLGAMLVTDVMFLHERGMYMGLYQWSLWSGVMLGPVVAGVTAQKYGWRSFWWICTALSCFAVLYQIFFLPETKFKRPEVEVVTENAHHTSTTELDSSEKAVGTTTEIFPETEINVRLSGSPSRRQFLPYTGFDKEEPILASIILPFKLFAFPIVQWASFVFSWCASCFLVVNVTQSQALAGPPWSLSPSAVGYTNFALFAGTSIALLTAGPLSDWVSMRATIKNRGIREPEMRLPALIPFACCTLIGSLVVCIGYQHGWSWEVIVIIGYTLLGIQVASLAAISTTYAVSCKPLHLLCPSSREHMLTNLSRSIPISLLQGSFSFQRPSTRTCGDMG